MRHAHVDLNSIAARPADRARIAKRLILAGFVLIVTAALAFAAPVFYEIWAKPQQVAEHQNELDHAIERQWENSTRPTGGQAATEEDHLFGRLYLPKLDRHWVVVRGVSDADIEYGPGVYSDSQPPGLPGNVAIFGHRRKNIFWDLDKVGRGDLIVLETKTQWFTYRVYNTKTVRPNDTSVISWDPDKPGVRTSRKLLTLITCTPKLSTTERLVVRAELTSTRSHTAGPPPGLPTK